jgi:hypothetical protein
VNGQPPGSVDVLNDAEHGGDWTLHDYCLTQDVFDELQATLNILIDHDACVRDDGTNSMCVTYSSPSRSFLHFDSAGHCVLLHPPSVTALASSMIDHYFASKRAAPSNTSALIVLPCPNEFLSHKVSDAGARLVRTYDRGAPIFETLVAGKLVPKHAHCPVQIWYDAPLTEPRLSRLDTAPQTMVFSGHLAAAPVDILVDSGASHTFVPIDLARMLNMRLHPSALKHAVLADSANKVPIAGVSKMRLKLGALNVRVNVLVLDTPSAGFDLILGDDFNLRYKTQLDWGTRTMKLTPTAAPSTIEIPVKTADDGPSTTALAGVLTAKQARRAIRKGAKAALFVVRSDWVPHTVSPAHAPRPRAPMTFACSPKASVAGSGLGVLSAAAPPPEVQQVLDELADVFQPVPPGLPPDRGVGHTIPLVSGSNPTHRRMQRFSPAELAEIKKQITELLEKGWIQPSSSPYSANVLFVGKKDGTLRMVYDYRALNAITVRNRYPLPRIEDMFDQLQGARYLSSLDLQTGYQQIRITPEDIPKTAFTTPLGHFEFKVLTFGLTNAPATFQACMNKLFAPYLGKFVLLYIDDIVVYSNTLSEHVQHLRAVLTVLRQNKLYAKMSKCTFAQSEIEYLGHIIGNGCLRVDPRKVKVVLDWLQPKDVSELRSFLGLANYFRRFIQGYSSLVSPLNDLLQQGVSFTWDSRQQFAFDAVKQALTSAPVLRLPDPSKPYEVITDASINGTGAVLMQDGHPIAYLSKKFSSAERNYATGEQELLACFLALKDWRCYLEGAEFTLVTDHCPLTTLKSQTTLSRKQARWLEYFSRFHYDWLYRPGRVNVADPLSRHPALLMLQAHRGATPQPHIAHEILAGYEADTWFHDPRHTRHFTKHPQGFWLLAVRAGAPAAIVVPNVKSLQQRIIHEHHSTPLAGHTGRDRTVHLIERQYWWPTLKRDVAQYVAQCDACQRNKARTGKLPGLLNPLPVPDSPWQHVTMDFITGLKPTKSGYDSICVFVDRLTKMVHFVPTKVTVTAEDTAFLLFNNVVKLHGEPETLITDRQSVFAGNFLPHYARVLGTQTRLTTAYHPQTDGQTERLNRVLEDMLRAFISPLGDNWDELLPASEFAVNNAYNSSVGNTPFYLNYGRHPRTPLWHELKHVPADRVPAAKTLAKRIDAALTSAKQSMQAAQQRQKAYFDKSKTDVTYSAGDKVLLDTRNMRRGKGAKMMPKWIGPYPVETMIGRAAVKLTLPSDMRIHPVFHVSMVKRYVPDPEAPAHVTTIPVTTDFDGVPIWNVDHIVEHREQKQRIGRKHSRKYRTTYEYKVRWTDCPASDDCWLKPADFSDKGASITAYWQTL